MTKTPPLSVRLGSNRLAEIDAWAGDLGMTRHAAVLALIDFGLGKGNKPDGGADRILSGLAEVAEIEAGRAKPARVVRVAVAPRPKLKLVLGPVQLGPVESKPGSRLKTPGKPKR